MAEDAPDLTIFGENDEVSGEATNKKSDDFKKMCEVSRLTNKL